MGGQQGGFILGYGDGAVVSASLWVVTQESILCNVGALVPPCW